MRHFAGIKVSSPAAMTYDNINASCKLPGRLKKAINPVCFYKHKDPWSHADPGPQAPIALRCALWGEGKCTRDDLEGGRRQREGRSTEEQRKGERKGYHGQWEWGNFQPSGPPTSPKLASLKGSLTPGPRPLGKSLLKNMHAHVCVPSCPQSQGLFRLLQGVPSFLHCRSV